MHARICTAVLRRFRRDDSAQDLIEYALLVALVALVAISAVSQVGTTILTCSGTSSPPRSHDRGWRRSSSGPAQPRR